jgi:hypothetical protein
MALGLCSGRKRNPLDPKQYADYDYIPPIEEDDEVNNTLVDMMHNNSVIDSNISGGRDHKTDDRGDIDMPYEPEHIPLTALMAKEIEEREPEEIILDGDSKVIDREVQDTGETVIHFEDGSYTRMNTEYV